MIGRSCDIRARACARGRGRRRQLHDRRPVGGHAGRGSTRSRRSSPARSSTATSSGNRDSRPGSSARFDHRPHQRRPDAETALRIGIALGTALDRGGQWRPARPRRRPASPQARRVRDHLDGVDVADLQVMPAAVTRHLMKTKAFGRPRPRRLRPEALELRIFEAPGIQATPRFIKEVEKNFLRQEFRRAAWDEVGASRSRRAPCRAYVEDLATLDTVAIRARGFRIVIDYSQSAASLVLPMVLGTLEVEAVTAHPYSGETGAPRRDAAVGGARPGEAARRVGRRRLRRRPRRERRAHLPRRRPGARSCGRAGAAAFPQPPELERPARAARVPDDGDEPRRGARRRNEARRSMRTPASLSAHPRCGRRRRHLRRLGRRRLRVSGLFALPTASPACASFSAARPSHAVVEARRSAARSVVPAGCAALGTQGRGHAHPHGADEGEESGHARRDQGLREGRLGPGAPRPRRAPRPRVCRGHPRGRHGAPRRFLALVEEAVAGERTRRSNLKPQAQVEGWAGSCHTYLGLLALPDGNASRPPNRCPTPSCDLIRELMDEERQVSYRRRILHGKIDILRAELRLEEAGGGGEKPLAEVDIDKL